MLKTNKSKKNVVILALSVMLAIAALFGATAAWFVASDSATGTAGTGTLEVSLNKESGFEVENIAAGDKILGDATATVTTTLEKKAFLRVQLSATGTGVEDGHITMAGTGWKEEGGFFYYADATGKLTAVGSEAGEAINLPVITLSTDSEAKGATITVTITVQVVQAANQTANDAATIADVEGWKTVNA